MCIRDRYYGLRICRFRCNLSPSRLTASRRPSPCLLYTSDAADDLTRVDLGGRRIFQAEDGIRDLVRSRGLGDVYKRQVLRIKDLPVPVQLVSVTIDGQPATFS